MGFTSDGSPLADVLNKHSALNKESIISILRHGCLVGENPKAMARKMTKAGYSDASHALLVARTESMRVAQEVGNENFKANGVDMVQWVSGETPYTCAACWAMSGKVFETGKQPHDHPNGRCVFNPYIPELAELDPDLYKHDRSENFAKLSEEEQKAVLGQKRYEMWKNGELNLTDLADTTDSDDYGESIKIKSLKGFEFDKDNEKWYNNGEKVSHINRNGQGNPSLIFKGLGKGLKNRQKRILEKLSEQNTSYMFNKKSVTLRDLAALTAETGDEFSMFTKNGKRLIFRGSENEIKALTVSKGKELNKLGYKWSGHTHPLLVDMPELDCLDYSDGDMAFLKQFKQDYSVIYNSKGRFRRFFKYDRLL